MQQTPSCKTKKTVAPPSNSKHHRGTEGAARESRPAAVKDPHSPSWARSANNLERFRK